MATNLLNKLGDRLFLRRFSDIASLRTTSTENQVRWFRLVNNDYLKEKALQADLIHPSAMRELWQVYFRILAPYASKIDNKQFEVLLFDPQGFALETYMNKTLTDEQVIMLVKHICFVEKETQNDVRLKWLLNLLSKYVCKHGFPDASLSKEKLASYSDTVADVICNAERSYLLSHDIKQVTDNQFAVILNEKGVGSVMSYIGRLCTGSDCYALSNTQVNLLIYSINHADEGKSPLLLDVLYKYVRKYGFPEDLKINGGLKFYSEAVAETIRKAEFVNYQLEVLEKSRESISSQRSLAKKEQRNLRIEDIQLGCYFTNLISWLKGEGKELSVEAQSMLKLEQYIYYSNNGFKLSKDSIVSIIAKKYDYELIKEILKREDVYPIWSELYDVLRNNTYIFYEYQEQVKLRYTGK